MEQSELTIERRRIRVTGVVQGVGFRPFVWTCAVRCGLTGWVINDSQGVLVEVQGNSSEISRFVHQLSESSPPQAIISAIDNQSISLIAQEATFSIGPSQNLAQQCISIAPDTGICAECLNEIRAPDNRRYRYPFTTCTLCGPRFTLLDSLPYDRARTTMASFAMCELCRREYEDPRNRRFNSEINCCSACGPRVWFVPDANASDEAFRNPIGKGLTSGFAAIERTQQAIREGQIVALKGIGGFHLACDAGCDAAIQRLRERKDRAEKPFALMASDWQTCQAFALVDEHERELLESNVRPIVLLTKRRPTRVSEKIAPGNPRVGVMLPYSPLHYLLLQPGDVWIMTSGNVAEEPIASDNLEAKRRLGTMADCFLLHDRRISVACDDSVSQIDEGDFHPIRRSRGYAPIPIRLSASGPCVLAVGGEIKSTICVTKGGQAYLSQHVGDTENQLTLLALEQTTDHLLHLLGASPQIIAADLHPGYHSSAWARRQAKAWNVPLVQVQHHHAHLAALMTEHGLAPSTQIIGCCFDGTGYGTDGAIWGGEWLIANLQDFQRFAKLSDVPLPGGDSCARRPCRTALAHLYQSGQAWSDWLPSCRAMSNAEQKILQQQLRRKLNCVNTSSMGRLFDAVASLIDVRHEVSYEAQAPIEIEALAWKAFAESPQEIQPYAIDWRHSQIWELDCGAIVRQICKDVRNQIDRSLIAARFHLTIAEASVRGCELARAATRIQQVGLSGGVFQNGLLLALIRSLLQKKQFQVLTHSKVPPNDGGLALGQAAIARERGSLLGLQTALEGRNTAS